MCQTPLRAAYSGAAPSEESRQPSVSKPADWEETGVWLEQSFSMAESLSLRGTLEGHAGWVTSITTPLDPNSDIIPVIF